MLNTDDLFDFSLTIILLHLSFSLSLNLNNAFISLSLFTLTAYFIVSFFRDPSVTDEAVQGGATVFYWNRLTTMAWY